MSNNKNSLRPLPPFISPTSYSSCSFLPGPTQPLPQTLPHVAGAHGGSDTRVLGTAADATGESGGDAVGPAALLGSIGPTDPSKSSIRLGPGTDNDDDCVGGGDEGDVFEADLGGGGVAVEDADGDAALPEVSRAEFVTAPSSPVVRRLLAASKNTPIHSQPRT